MKKSRRSKSNLERLCFFISRITHNSDCWEYQPEKYTDYIQLKVRACEYFEGKSTSLHRFVYAVVNDEHLSTADVIMHTCDNRICINPKHLKKGTIQTNNADRTRKQKRLKRTK